MSGKLVDKVAIVTGAAAGMGKAIAEAYAKEGAKVILADVDSNRLDQVKNDITDAGGTAIAVKADMSKEEDINAMVKAATDSYGKLDVLVNNAGIMDNFLPVGNVTDDVWTKVMAVNLTGPFMACRAAINIMNDQPNGGVIVNNASVGGLFGTRGGATYTASKHGLVGLTKNIAATYGVYGKIRANAIAPGGVATDIEKKITAPDPLGSKALQAVSGAGNELLTGQPEQIASLAVFLASDDSSFVNGDIVKADGGWTAA